MEMLNNSRVTLFVDLDGTLIKTDLLFEMILLLFKRSPFSIFLLPLWFLRGRAYLKDQLTSRTLIEPANLPYHQPFLDYLHTMSKQGKRLVLATGSNERVARKIADHLGIFDRVIGSGEQNMTGHNKLAAIKAMQKGAPFAYAGDSRKDIPIWKDAEEAILVNPAGSVRRKATRSARVTHTFWSRRSRISTLFRALRVHQWVKNTLIFVPLVTAHRFTSLYDCLMALAAFVAFCSVCSGTYMINDLLDLEVDRRHHLKKGRPFASGDLPLSSAFLLVPATLIFGVVVGSFLPPAFLMTLGLYTAMSLSYSLYLKKKVLVDVIALASLFTLRIFSGAHAIDVPISHWLLAFSMFIFLSLAFVKRYAELHNLKQTEVKLIPRRGYRVDDIEQLRSFGTMCGCIAVLVLALYVDSLEASGLYAMPSMLWLLCPALFYWIARIWIAAQRGEMHEDPIIFAFKDRVSYVVGFLVALVLLISI